MEKEKKVKTYKSVKKYLTISEFAKEIGVSEQCLRNWDNEGTLKCHHKSEKGGYRYYTEEQVKEYLEEKKRDKEIIMYVRKEREEESRKQIEKEGIKGVKIEIEGEDGVEVLGGIIMKLVRKEVSKLIIGKGVELEAETLALLKKATEGVNARLRVL